MILSDKEIMAAVHAGSLSISPFSESQVQSAGFDFTIGNTFAQLAARENEYIQPGTMPKYKMLTQNRYLLDPGEYILVSTAEYFRFPDDLAALITLRNTYIRLGLFSQNAGCVSPGFEGRITIALCNMGKGGIVIESGACLGQLLFMRTAVPAAAPYRGRYQGQDGVSGSGADAEQLASDDA